MFVFFFFFQAEDGIRDLTVTGVQTCALPICRADLVLGNLGLNSYVRASPTEPARLYVHDFGHNGALEQILTFYKHGVSYPLAGRDELVRLIPQLRSRYPDRKSTRLNSSHSQISYAVF